MHLVISAKMSANMKRVYLFMKDILYVILIPLTVIPILFVSVFVSFIFYSLAYFISLFLPGYGKFASSFDVLLEEDFTNSIPRNPIVHTLVLDGDISLSHLRSVFGNNVLNLKCKDNPWKGRYPELKQYLTTLLGFKIWKDDEKFHLDDHIHESSISVFSMPTKSSNLLQSIHHVMINRKYKFDKSPWEIILLRNVPGAMLDNEIMRVTGQGKRSVLACRFHHVMADGKSMIKLFVEGLGDKKLNTASSHPLNYGLADQIIIWLLFPVNFVRTVAKMAFLVHRSQYHPWAKRCLWSETDIHSLISFTPNLSLELIKKVAQKNGVATSAVVMAMVAGGVGRITGKAGGVDTSVGCSLPKPGHPDFLTNHMSMCALSLPVSERDVKKRLLKCNEEQQKGKAEQVTKSADFLLALAGNLIFPLSRLTNNQACPVGLTNMAGDKDGFKIGGLDCVDFSMTVGTISGVGGVAFCAFSYKDTIRISVIAKENVLNQNQVDQLAVDVAYELDILLDLVKQ